MKPIGLFLFCLGLVACGNREITTRQVPKDPPAPSLTDLEEAPKLDITWTKPENWSEDANGKQNRGMGIQQLMAYNIHREFGHARITITLMPGMSGGHLSNINRWLSQIGLSPLTEETLTTALKKGQSPLGPFEWVHLQGEKESILGAIYSIQGHSLFLKARGGKDLIQMEEKNFLAFCQSVHLKTTGQQ